MRSFICFLRNLNQVSQWNTHGEFSNWPKGISKYNHYQSADQLTNLIASERRVIYSFSDQRLVLFLLVYLKLNRQVPAARIFILSFLRCSSFLKFLCSPCIFPHPSHSLSLSLCAHSFIFSAINLPFQHYFFHFPPRSFFHLCLLYSLIGFQYNINPLKSLRDLNS